MINLYTGTPGSGKSLHLAELLYNRIKFKKSVIVGNFDIEVKNIKGKLKGDYLYIDNMDLTPDKLINFSLNYQCFIGRRLKEGELLLVIDECQILFNSREWQQTNRNAWLSFYTQHRKLGYDIILITQFDRMIDRQIRALVENEVIHRKINNYGFVGSILGILFGGSLFVCIKMWYPMKERLGAHFFICRKKYYKIYDSYKLFNTSDTLGSKGPPLVSDVSNDYKISYKFKKILSILRKFKKLLPVVKTEKVDGIENIVSQ